MDKLTNHNDNNRIFEESTYIWILHKFSELKNTYGREVSFESPIFPENDTKCKWKLRIYPNGGKSAKNRVSIFLVKSNDNPVFAKYTLCIRNSDDEDIFEKEIHHTFTEDAPDWGFLSAIPHNKLTSSFNDDIMKIHVFVSAEVFILQDSHKTVMHSSQMAVLQHLESMFSNEEFSDFVIKFNDSSEKKVHRSILSARSPVFSAMVKHDTSESKLGYVEITDIDKDIMLQLLRFIYTGKTEDFSVEEAQNLLIAADKYEILDLKEICADSLTKNLRISSVLDILILAEVHNSPKLKDNAFDYILKHAWKFSEPAMFGKLANKCPDVLAELAAKLAKMFENKLNTDAI